MYYNTYNITDDHMNRLPYIRIKKITVQNLKSVGNGVIEFNCYKEPRPYNTVPDILGLYGQNGSGKSTLIQAIALVKGLICGFRIGKEYADIIDVIHKTAYIKIEFDYQYNSGVHNTVVYEVNIDCKEKEVDVRDEKTGSIYKQRRNAAYIYNEKVSTDIYEDGNQGRIRTIIDTEKNLFCRPTHVGAFYDVSDMEKSIVEELTYIKRNSYENSRSFVFDLDLHKLFEREEYSKYYEILAELQMYANEYLYYISLRSSGMVQLRAGIPIYIPNFTNNRPIVLSEKLPVPKGLYAEIEKQIHNISKVLGTIIPEMKLEISGVPTVLDNGEKGVYPLVKSVRGDRVIPLQNESDGIIRIVSFMALYIFAIREHSATILVDEIDSGVFEYLLGELLEIFSEEGKGQLIFTSHNLRLLEVLDKKYIRFTTTDRNNRYYKIKNVRGDNNLRDIYLREVQYRNLLKGGAGDSGVELYKKSKRFKIVDALKYDGEE